MFFDAKASAARHEHEARAFIAYYSGLFSQPMKSRPSFERFLGRRAAAPKVQSWQSHHAMALAWHAAITARATARRK